MCAPSRLPVWAVLVFCGLSFAAPGDAWAAQRTWIGGNADWIDGANANFWNPADEPDADDEAIFNTANIVNLASNNMINGLTLSAGIDLSTNDFDLLVDGLTQLSGVGTNLFVRGVDSALNSDDVTIGVSGTLELDGGLLIIDEESGTGFLTIDAGGGLIGHGTVDFLDIPLIATALLNNNGTLTALTRSTVIILPPPLGTLQINADGSFARINLDGSNETGIVNVNRNQTLDINIPLTDPFNGIINLSHNANLDIADPWTMAGGTLDVNNGATGGIPGIPAGTSFIAGGTFTQTGGTITVQDDDGTLQFNAVSSIGGDLVNPGHLVFNANATISASANVTMPSGSSSLTVGPGATVQVNQANFNADGIGVPTNVLTVRNGGALNLNLGAGADELLTGLIRLQGGTLQVVTSDNTWGIDGDVEVPAGTGTSLIRGEPVTMNFVTTTVGAGSTLGFTAPLTIGDDATFTGPGNLFFQGPVTVEDTTTLDMSGGIVDLDGADTIGDLIYLSAGLTINADTLAAFGRPNPGGGTNTIVIDVITGGSTGSLTVNLDDADAEWTLNPQGVIEVLNGSGLFTLIQGSDINVNGTLNVTGNVGCSARLDIGGTISLLTAPPPNGLLLQSDVSAGPNRLDGGTIHGPGALKALNLRVLEGFGSIHARVAFEGSSILRAQGGNMIVTGIIEDIGEINVAADGTFHVSNAWNSGVAEFITLDGGTLSGATVTVANNNGITGHGTVSSRVINNTIMSADGGTLHVETGGHDNDWDGVTGLGHLRALGGGTLSLVDNFTFGFTGTLLADSGSTVSTTGFGFDFDPGSTINLTGGTLQSSSTTAIGGNVNVNAGPDSTVEVAVNFFLDFESTSNTTLNGNLILKSNNAGIKAGADFSGNGALIVPDDSHLVAAAGAEIDVLLDIQGSFRPGGYFVPGRVDLRDYQQAATAELYVDLEGTALNQFDRIVVDGDVVLDGLLEVRVAGFVPVAGNTFTIISANSILGTFDDVQSFSLPDGLFLRLNYLPTSVQLVIVEALPGDFDADGDVDGDDYFFFAACMDGPGDTIPPPGCTLEQFAECDTDGDFDVDMHDFLSVQGCYSGPGVPADMDCGG